MTLTEIKNSYENWPVVGIAPPGKNKFSKYFNWWCRILFCLAIEDVQKMGKLSEFEIACKIEEQEENWELYIASQIHPRLFKEAEKYGECITLF
jgi:hypothetical protein